MQMSRTHLFAEMLLLATLSTLAIPAFSMDYQSHSSIKETARHYLLEQLTAHQGRSMEIDVRIGRLDPRLRLSQCHLPLEPFLPPGANLDGNTSVGIRCQDHKPWSLYVAARIIKFADVYIAKRFLPRGRQLQADDFTLERRDISSQAVGYITDLDAIVGKMVRRPLRYNSVIPPNALYEPTLVKRGQQVTIVARHTGVNVRMKGKALKNGTEGEVIRVENLSSKRIIEGKVLSAGIVAVQL